MCFSHSASQAPSCYCSFALYSPDLLPALRWSATAAAGHKQKHRKDIKKKIKKDSVHQQHKHGIFIPLHSGMARHKAEFFFCLFSFCPFPSGKVVLGLSVVTENLQFCRGVTDTCSLKSKVQVGAETSPSPPCLLLQFYILRDNMLVVLCGGFHETQRIMKRGEETSTEPSRRNLQPLLTGNRSKAMTCCFVKWRIPQPIRDPLYSHFPDYLYCCKTKSRETRVPSLSLPLSATLQK